MWLAATILESVDLADLHCKMRKTTIGWTGFYPSSATDYSMSLVKLFVHSDAVPLSVKWLTRWFLRFLPDHLYSS